MSEVKCRDCYFWWADDKICTNRSQERITREADEQCEDGLIVDGDNHNAGMEIKSEN